MIKVRGLNYSQVTPRMQVAVLIQAAQGHLLNAEDRLQDSKELQRFMWTRLPEILDRLARAQEILRQMPEGNWSNISTHK